MLHGSSTHTVSMAVTVSAAILHCLLHKATAVLLGSSDLGLLEQGTADSLSLDIIASQSSSHHLGYAPVHVTRLHRYDHSGLDAFLEREMAWESRAAVEGAPYLEMSRVQTDELRRHHESWLQDGSREDAALPHHIAGDASGSSLEFLAKAETRFSLASKQAVTGLSSLSSQYVGPMGVGTVFDGCDHEKDNCLGREEANIWAVFDTGSTNIWVSSDLCERGACVMEGRKRYNHTRSHTYSTPATNVQLTVQFGTGKLKGPQGVDDLHIGPFTIHNQTFALIETQNGSVFEHVPFEGIVGLAFPSMSANNVTPFFDNVIKQKVLQHNEFGVYFSPSNPTANAIFWGGVDSRFYEDSIEYFPVVDSYYWAIGLHSFKIGDDVLLGVGGKFNTDVGSYLSDLRSSTSSSLLSTSVIQLSMQSDSVTKVATTRREPVAILDTGTTYFTAETKLFSQILQRLPPMQCAEISDETHPPITYGLKNAAGTVSELVFTHDMYMVRSSRGDGDDRCAPAFMRIDIPAAHGPGMVLGETFLRSYFAVFDRGVGGTSNEGRVGLARSLHTDTAIDRLRELTSAQPSFMDSRQKL